MFLSHLFRIDYEKFYGGQSWKFAVLGNNEKGDIQKINSEIYCLIDSIQQIMSVQEIKSLHIETLMEKLSS